MVFNILSTAANNKKSTACVAWRGWLVGGMSRDFDCLWNVNAILDEKGLLDVGGGVARSQLAEESLLNVN